MSSYAITAFAESDLVSGNLSYGDVFTMPAAPTVELNVSDNDNTLSGDWGDNSSDHYGQTAAITDASGNELGNGGQIYAECYTWVTDQYGNSYVLIQIEQENGNEDYFTFLTDYGHTVPPAGSILTVGCSRDVCGEWLKLDELGCGDMAPATGSISGRVFADANADGLDGYEQFVSGQDYTIQAEHMQMNGFHVAGNGDIAKMSYHDNDGDLRTNFNGQDGTYDISLFIQDESDGKSTVELLVNGQLVEAILLDRSSDGWGSDYGSFSEFVITGVEINAGDEIKLVADRDCGEFVRIDKMELRGHDQAIVVADPPKADIEVRLVDMDGTVVETTYTDADGNYTFDTVEAGDYRVVVVNPDGTEFTTQNVGDNDGIDSDFDMGGLSGVISVGAGQDVTDVDAGLLEVSEPTTPTGPVAPSITLTANDDAITVLESETAGDLDGNVLTNDTQSSSDGTVIDLEVTSVGNGNDAGVWVQGSDGGRAKINADGTVDFDAMGDFDALTDTQSAQTTFTYQISTEGEVVATQNVLFVFDVSNSTVRLDGENAFVGEGVGDVNGDGKADTVLDAQISAAKALIQDIKDKGIDPANVNVGIVTFSGVADGFADVNSADLGTFSLGDTNLLSMLDSIQSGGWTNYEAGLGEAEDWFTANAGETDENVMYFLSDGRPITGHDGSNYIEQNMSDFGDEVARIENNFGAAVHAIGVGENASMAMLNAIDNSADGAAQVSSVSELTTELVAAHSYPGVSSTATLTVTVQGEEVRVANNDLIIVNESETSGDVEVVNGNKSSILSNDVLDAGAYAGTVATVNGSVTNVNVAIEGSNGGLATINADGTVDFDANGAFDSLMNGQSADTSFTYTIQGGEMATLTVRVNGETDYDALNDVMTVSESEAFGDNDGNVLVNDTQDNGAYTGDVLAVNGSASNVAQEVSGDNGGKLIINADGSMDFSADGAFESLNDGDSEFTTFSYEIEGGETATVTFEVEGETDIVVVEPPENKTLNIAIALQSDSTMYVGGDPLDYVADWADWDGNGVANQQMDLAYLMVADFLPEAFAGVPAEGWELNISLVTFDAKGNEYFSLSESNWQGKLTAKIASDNGGDYGAAFDNASAFFADVSEEGDTNEMFFIGSGLQTGAWQDEREDMIEDFDVNINTHIADFVIDTESASYSNMLAIDTDGVAAITFSDDTDANLPFGIAQETLQYDFMI